MPDTFMLWFHLKWKQFTHFLKKWIGDIHLPMQGTQVLIPGQGTKILHAAGQLSLCSATEDPMPQITGDTAK